jgi:chloride channel protein, CIC family
LKTKSEHRYHTRNSSEIEGNPDKVKRTLYISALALINAIIVGFIAKALLLLINFFTNLFFYGEISFHEVSPSHNSLGYWVITIPVLGGLIIGFMARFGSRAIRGHGIPEAMEKIFKEESRIHPVITILKPLSAAISIGTGGPFGAEGPIISTGGALGSFCGQTLHITAHERKILLAAGATSGMTAIFGTPFAAILLAIELLLFEFSARSFVPVMIACVTGACMHFLLFGTAPTFPMPEVAQADTYAVIAYGVMGIAVGLSAVIVTKGMYLIEDGFEKLPIHWMWWPAIGGLAVGIIGTFAPTTLGVGYENITNALSGELPVNILISLCFWKFVSWAIALGSGTSGGTLAPLLTIGSAIGCLLGMVGQQYFPEAHINLPMAALVGMAALFAGSARALLTSIVFAMETTMQESTLLPLIAGCVTSYLVSFIFMRSTIMTEKIKRRGITLPDSYHPDLLEVTTVGSIIRADMDIPRIQESVTIKELKYWLSDAGLSYNHKTLLVSGKNDDELLGTINRIKITENKSNHDFTLATLMTKKIYSVYNDNSVQLAVEFMLKTGQDILPVVDRVSKDFVGVITERDVLRVFEQRYREEKQMHKHISMTATTRRILRKGRKLFNTKTW